MRCVIIGGVAGGAGTAARLRRLDEECEIIMLEKDQYISFANCGLPYYLSGVIKDEQKILLQTPRGFGNRFNVDVRVLNEMISLNAEKKCITVRDHSTGQDYDLSYDNLILTPGAVPVIPKISISEEMPIFTMRNIPDTNAIKNFVEQKKPQSACIIGGGFIGVEIAENLHEMGIDVTIIEATSHLFQNIDEDMSYSIHGHIRSKGVRLVTGQTASEITAEGVNLNNGGFIPCDFVTIAAGVRPATDFLRNSGLELGERGEIIVDDYLKTNLEGVWALGDAASCINFVSKKRTVIPLAGPANRQARIAADNICGLETKYQHTQGTAIAKVFDMAVASTGLTEQECLALGLDYYAVFSAGNHHAGYYPDPKMMMLKLLCSKDGKVLGGQITGYEGVDKRIDVLAVAIRAGMTANDLHQLELSYAPPFSSAKDPVNMIGYVADNIVKGKTKMIKYQETIDKSPDQVFRLDVRQPKEFEKGAIPGFINIPLPEIRSRLEEIPRDKTIYLCCLSGQRSYFAQTILNNLGYDTYNVFGSWMLYALYKADLEARAYESEITANCARPEFN